MSFDLRAYARRHRYRLRNLHDGAPVPPARSSGKPSRPVYTGEHDRWDAIVGKCGYVAMDGDRLSVFAQFGSVRAKTAGMRKLVDAGMTITQEGDTEVGGLAAVACIEPVLAVIRVSRLRPGAADFRSRVA